MKELWKDIKGYEGLYMISNKGRVKSLEKVVGSGYIQKERYLKESICVNGYAYYSLSKQSKTKKFKTHRLIAIHFIPNPNKKEQINHIDGNKLNNSINNLEWCTQSENMKHCYEIGLQKPKKGSKNKLSKKVHQYDFNGKLINVFGSGREAMRITGIQQTNISACCLGKVKSAGGYVWAY